MHQYFEWLFTTIRSIYHKEVGAHALSCCLHWLFTWRFLSANQHYRVHGVHF